MTTLSLTDPQSDPEFSLECTAAREAVLTWWNHFMEIVDAKPRTKAINAKARAVGIPEGTFRNNFYSFLKSGCDWRHLIDRARFPEPGNASLPPAFRTWFVALYEGHQRDRTGKQAYRALMARLAAWELSPFDPELVIPGYDTPPPRSPYTHHPKGWSVRSLYLVLQRESSVYARSLRRQGPKAASVYLPKVHTSREGLAFGQIFYHDDSQHDVYVNLTGRNSKAMRPLSFNSLEALSGSLCLLGLKPQLENANGDGRSELTQLDFFWHLMWHLTTVGYNASAGTVHVMEHGTTNIDKAANFDEQIRRVTGGKVIVDRSGKFGPPSFKEMLFEGQSSGNFRFKAPIESFFQNVRNYSAMLPGPTGLSREKAPEENSGMLLRNDGIQRLIEKFDQQTFLRFTRPVLEWEDYTRLCRALHQIIDQRTDHQLQGWHKLGFTKQSYRLSLDSPWIGEREYQMIPAAQRAAFDHIVRNPGYFKTELLSPAEVFQRQRHQLTCLPLSMVPVLAPERAWSTLTVSKSLEIELHDQQIDSEPLRYIAKLRPVKGVGTITLERGTSYKYLLNPLDATHLYVADKQGSFLGTAERLIEPCKLNYEAIVSQLGGINTIRADENVPVHARMRSEASQRVEDYHHNKMLKSGAPVTSEDRARVRTLRDLAGTASELLDAPQEEAFSPADEPAFDASELL